LPSRQKGKSQSSILIHKPNNRGNWSGGIGCQLVDGFNEYSSQYSREQWRKKSGSYHLINMSKE
jgi:hypothetical protein